jgi:3-methyladenine DNA glycosylase/8-oxoguanine DNA glycosylase
MPAQPTIDLIDPSGNQACFERIAQSHGLAGVAPWTRTEDGGLEITTMLGSQPRTLRISRVGGRPDLLGGTAKIEAAGQVLADGQAEDTQALARRVLGLDRDLTNFHSLAQKDAALSWVPDAGAGWMARSATVFEDVIRTILTTNCAWSSTVSMCTKMVDALGREDPATGLRAFPGPEEIAAAGAQFLRDEIRVGYRAEGIVEISSSVAEGRLELEELGSLAVDELPDAEVERRLRSLPGIGPYAAAHAMLLIGRPSLVILDSWTRPKFARMTGRKTVSDSTIRRHVGRFGPDAGLALWLILTKEWFEPES